MDTEPRRPRVLVVEDNPANAYLLQEQLEASGYSVDCALDGNRAVTMACTGEYAALLLDLNMPEYDGVEVLRIVRKRMLLRPIKVIVVTGDIAGTRRRALNAEGIDGYVTKPVDLLELCRTLGRIVPAVAAA